MVKDTTVCDNGQIIKVLIPVIKSVKNIALIAPSNLSAPRPKAILPTADAKLKPNKINDPVDSLRPIAEAYRGKKNGATKSGKSAMAPAKNSKLNRISLKRDLQAQSC